MSRAMLAIVFPSGSISDEFFNGLHSICCECIFVLENVSLSQYASADVSIGLYTMKKYIQLGLKPKAGTKKLLLSVNLQWSFYAVSIKSLKPLLHIAQWFHFIIVLPFYQYQWTISGRIFESITLLRICAGQYKHAECLNFSFSLPERPYIDQQIRETSELPEGRPPCSSTEPFCRDIFTQADTFILILLQMIFTHLILLK